MPHGSKKIYSHANLDQSNTQWHVVTTLPHIAGRYVFRNQQQPSVYVQNAGASSMCKA